MTMKPRIWKDVKKDLLRDPETASAYEDLQEEFSFISLMIETRQKKGLSQADLAAKIGTTQGNISRLESGRYNPSVRFLRKVAHALEKELEVRFK